jgi:hypothetical protein
MSDEQTSPGPIADHVFETGFRVGAILGVVGSAILFLVGPLSLTNGVHVSTAVLLFPVYLLSVSILLGLWLGYATDENDLELVNERADIETGDIRDWWG